MILPRKNETIEIRESGNRKVSVDCSGPTKTEQSHKNRVNIVSIMRKANRIGMLPNMERIQTARYGDFSGENDFQSLMDRVIRANSEFEALPSEIRERFMNNPGKLIEFLNNADNQEEAVKLGLRKATVKPPEPDPEQQEPAG